MTWRPHIGDLYREDPDELVLSEKADLLNDNFLGMADGTTEDLTLGTGWSSYSANHHAARLFRWGDEVCLQMAIAPSGTSTSAITSTIAEAWRPLHSLYLPAVRINASGDIVAAHIQVRGNGVTDCADFVTTDLALMCTASWIQTYSRHAALVGTFKVGTGRAR